jgi:putative tryptophan/tyrosine transport system substrate-binding protein
MRRRDFISAFGGTAVAWPLAARGQQTAMPVIGFLHSNSSVDTTARANLAAFQRGLGEAGYIEGQNVAIEYRWAAGRYDLLPALAADLVGRKVDLIFAGGPPAARVAKNATSIIPIVFTSGTDPVADGLVVSLARPGGNVTGVAFLGGDLTVKRLALLSDLVPRARAIALLANPNSGTSWLGDVQKTAEAKGMQLHVLKAATESEIDAAFAAIVELHADALVVGDDPFFTSRDKHIVALAARHALPAAYQSRNFAAAGGLISYGASFQSGYHQAGLYAGRILKGAKPAGLPVFQPTQFELVINLTTAKTLGVAIPPSILARADELIE